MNSRDLFLIVNTEKRKFQRALLDTRDGYIGGLTAGSVYGVTAAFVGEDLLPVDYSTATVELAIAIANLGADDPLAFTSSWTPVILSAFDSTKPTLQGTLDLSTSAIQDEVTAAIADSKTYFNAWAAMRITPSGGSPMEVAGQLVRLNCPKLPTSWTASGRSVFVSGSQAAVIGDNTITVTNSNIASGFAFESLALVWANGSAVENIILGPVITVTSTGFTVLLSAAPANAGLSLKWKVANL